MFELSEKGRFLRPAAYSFSEKGKTQAEFDRWFDIEGKARERPLDEAELVKYLVKEYGVPIKEARQRVRDESQATADDKAGWLRYGKNPLAEQMIALMLGQIELHGLEVLEHYPNDVHIHDRNTLNIHATNGMDMAWTVSDTSTHLVPLGLSLKKNEEVSYLMNLSSRQRFYRLSINNDTCCIKELTREAFAELGRVRVPYRLGAPKVADGLNTIYRNDVKIGMIHLKDIGNWNSRAYEVTILPEKGLCLRDQIALQVFSERLPVDITGTLFVRTKVEWAEELVVNTRASHRKIA